MQIMSGRIQGRAGVSRAAPAAGARPTRTMLRVRASAVQASTDRRGVLLAGGLLAASSLLLATQPAVAAGRMLSVEQLGSFQKSGQKDEFRIRAETVIKESLSTSDAAAARKLVFNDAGTYDAATNTGGLDGSIATTSELDRPENAGLKPLVEKLKDVKKKIDALAAPGQQGISWADLMVLTAKTLTQREWAEMKIKRAKLQSGGEIIASTAFSAPWPLRLGRKDRTDAAPAGRVPKADAPVEEIRDYLLKLGTPPDYKPSPFRAKPAFWERPGFLIWTETSLNPDAEIARWAAYPQFADIAKKYQNSKRTLTRTDFEVDFIETFAKLTSLGAEFDPNAYLFPIPMSDVKL